MSQRGLTHLFDVAVQTRERFGGGGNHAGLVKAHDGYKNVLCAHIPFHKSVSKEKRNARFFTGSKFQCSAKPAKF